MLLFFFGNHSHLFSFSFLSFLFLSVLWHEINFSYERQKLRKRRKKETFPCVIDVIFFSFVSMRIWGLNINLAMAVMFYIFCFFFFLFCAIGQFYFFLALQTIKGNRKSKCIHSNLFDKALETLN